MRSSLLGAGLICLLFLSAVAGQQPNQASQKTGDRYRIVAANDMVFLLDSLNGESWMLDGRRGESEMRWLKVGREEHSGRQSSENQVRKTQGNQFAVDFAPEADSVIVRGNQEQIAKAALILQRSEFGNRSGLEITVSFFPDLDFGHIQIPGRRADMEEVSRIVKDLDETKRIILTNISQAKAALDMGVHSEQSP